MKEMIYCMDCKSEILDTGKYLGFTYYILNLGTHPTAYIKIPKTHKYYGIDYNDLDINVHGGLTYSKNKLIINFKELKGWFIGWDYAHYGDYVSWQEKTLSKIKEWGSSKFSNKKWTTQEILEDVKSVCKQLKED